MLNIMSKISNVLKSPKLDSWLEKLEQAEAEKEKNKRLSKALRHSKAIYKQKRKSTYC